MVSSNTIAGSALRPKLRRPPTKRRLILAALRNQIVRGEFPPGSQLPTRARLIEQFDASSITIQEALDRLVRDGMVVAMGRQGTFVTQRPPHLHQYGVVFPDAPSSPQWARYWTALTNEAHAIESAGDRRFKFYHGVNWAPGNPGHHELINDVRAQRLAGVIMTFAPDILQGSPAIADPLVPLVGLSSTSFFTNAHSISLDYPSLIDKALDDLSARGAKRIACLMLPQMSDDFIEKLNRGIQSRALTTHPAWIQAVAYSPARWVSQLAQLLVHGKPAERPDGLFIADDNLVEHASAGLIAAGITGSSDLRIVGHANFPWPTPSHLPMRRVGFDIRQTLEAACSIISSVRAGQPAPMITRIGAEFEDELITGSPRRWISTELVIPITPGM